MSDNGGGECSGVRVMTFDTAALSLRGGTKGEASSPLYRYALGIIVSGLCGV